MLSVTTVQQLLHISDKEGLIMKKFEYREPEFNVVITAKEDIITASTLSLIADDWSAGGSPNGEGGAGNIGFGL